MHFIVPDSRGAQPFDVIAVKDGIGFAVECKTLSEDKKSFNISRLEDNQEMAFGKWRACGNTMPEIWVEHGDEIYRCPYDVLAKKGTVKLKDMWRDEDAERIRMRLQSGI